MATTLKLTKTENVKGETWYYIYIDTECVKAFVDSKGDKLDETLNAALDVYNDIKKRMDEGYPKTTTVLEHIQD